MYDTKYSNFGRPSAKGLEMRSFKQRSGSFAPESSKQRSATSYPSNKSGNTFMVPETCGQRRGSGQSYPSKKSGQSGGQFIPGLSRPKYAGGG